MKHFAFPLVLGLASLLVLSCEKEKESGSGAWEKLTDKEMLQGSWKMISCERGGAPLGSLENCSLKFDGNKVMFNMQGIEMNGLARMDYGSTPKIFDLQLTAPGQPQDKGPIAKGIYELNGDTLKWCNAAPGGDVRPADFSTTKENNQMVAVFERVKK